MSSHPRISVGDIVYLASERNKLCARGRYIVTDYRYEHVSEPVEDALTEDLSSLSDEHTPSSPIELTRPYNDGVSGNPAVISDEGSHINEEDIDDDPLIAFIRSRSGRVTS